VRLTDTPKLAADIFTIGHSTHSLAEFADLLKKHAIECVADVRAHPGSRRAPHFNREALATALPDQGIAYEHFRNLGGRRRPRPDSPNTGWENQSFRGYADHMESGGFMEALAALERTAETKRTAIMCVESVWWRCHRRLVSDALLSRGHRVLHIGGDGRLSEHQLTSFALVDGDRLTYPSATVAGAEAQDKPSAGNPVSVRTSKPKDGRGAPRVAAGDTTRLLTAV
jgi:uncharacterized protein (DUF488 family)